MVGGDQPGAHATAAAAAAATRRRNGKGRGGEQLVRSANATASHREPTDIFNAPCRASNVAARVLFLVFGKSSLPAMMFAQPSARHPRHHPIRGNVTMQPGRGQHFGRGTRQSKKDARGAFPPPLWRPMAAPENFCCRSRRRVLPPAHPRSQRHGLCDGVRRDGGRSRQIQACPFLGRLSPDGREGRGFARAALRAGPRGAIFGGSNGPSIARPGDRPPCGPGALPILCMRPRA
jgi:hypothetical protein